MPLLKEAESFVAEWAESAGYLPGAGEPETRQRVDRVCQSMLTLVFYGRRYHLEPDALLHTPAMLLAYDAMQPHVSQDAYLRIAHLWRWRRQHPGWQPARDPFLVLSADGGYRWVARSAARLLGYDSTETVLRRGEVGRTHAPAERATLTAALRTASQQAARYVVRPARTGADVQFDTEPIRTDDGRPLAILARLRPAAVVDAPRLPSRPATPPWTPRLSMALA